MKTQLVSVIIPNYNKGEYLKECLDSVTSQGEIVKEIIIVDDHSDDNSWEILLDYSNRFDYVKIFKNPKKGAQSARNYGFLKSSGKYIQWLDSDDILGSNKIEKQAIVLEQKNTLSVAFCGWSHFSENINEGIPRESKIWKDYQNPINWLIDAWSSGNMLVPSCWLVPQRICAQLTWNETILKNQDGLYFFDVLMKSQELVFSSGVLIYYRKPGKTNVSQRQGEKPTRSVLRSYKHYEKILERKDNKTVRDALAINYLSFIYSISPDFKEMQREAYQSVEKLNLSKLPLVGGSKFQIFQKLFGFRLALYFKQFFG